MSVTDEIELVFYETRGTYIFMQGRETFYDDDDILLEFESPSAAMDYALDQGWEIEISVED